jgi:beta-glucosidase
VAFERVHLKVGEQKEVKLTLNPRYFSLINRQSKRVIEAGAFTLHVGSGQPQFAPKKALIQKRIRIKGSAELPL